MIERCGIPVLCNVGRPAWIAFPHVTVTSNRLGLPLQVDRSAATTTGQDRRDAGLIASADGPGVQQAVRFPVAATFSEAYTTDHGPFDRSGQQAPLAAGRSRGMTLRL